MSLAAPPLREVSVTTAAATPEVTGSVAPSAVTALWMAVAISDTVAAPSIPTATRWPAM